MSKDSPDIERTNILVFQPPVTNTNDGGCPEEAVVTEDEEQMTQEGLRLFKAYFSIEDAALRTSLLAMMETISTGARAGPKREGC